MWYINVCIVVLVIRVIIFTALLIVETVKGERHYYIRDHLIGGGDPENVYFDLDTISGWLILVKFYCMLAMNCALWPVTIPFLVCTVYRSIKAEEQTE